MRTFFAGLAVALVLAGFTGLLYGLAGISAKDYFSTEYARLDEGMPEQLRGEEGQRLRPWPAQR